MAIRVKVKKEKEFDQSHRHDDCLFPVRFGEIKNESTDRKRNGMEDDKIEGLQPYWNESPPLVAAKEFFLERTAKGL